MTDTFEEAYARYLEGLSQLDQTHDISEKNVLFRELAALLSEMEQTIKNKKTPPAPQCSLSEEDMGYWI